MTPAEIKQLAKDVLKKPCGPWENYGEVFLGIEYDSIEDAEAEARRLNAMPGLLRAAYGWFLEPSDDVDAELLALIARCKAHQKGEAE
jgi:hypothetical protein